jgi:hypothetical protein
MKRSGTVFFAIISFFVATVPVTAVVEFRCARCGKSDWKDNWDPSNLCVACRDAAKSAALVEPNERYEKPVDAAPKNDGERLLQNAKNITGRYDTDPGLKVSDGENGRFNCTTYVETAIRKAGFEVTDSMSKQINIRLPEGANLSELLKGNDPRVTGIVGALVDSGQGSLVKNCNDMQKGDLVQMWRLKRDGTNEGHTGIIDKANGRDFVLWGAHKSLGRIGNRTYHLDEWNHAWCVRPDKK